MPYIGRLLATWGRQVLEEIGEEFGGGVAAIVEPCSVSRDAGPERIR